MCSPRALRSRFVAVTLFLALLCLVGCPSGGGDVDDDDDITGPEIPDDPEAGTFAAMVLAAEVDGVLANLLMPGGPVECVTTEPAVWMDADADGVPDDRRYTFSLEGCKFTLGNGGWGSTSGRIRIVDPGPAWGFQASLEAYGYWSYLPDNDPPWTVSREHTGTTTLSGSAPAPAFSLDHAVLFRVTGEPDASLSEVWSGTYVPTGAEPFDYTLGAGTMTLSGTSVFSRNNVAIHLSLETVTPLRWEASCDCVWPQGGVIRAHVTAGGPSGYLEITYSDCWRMGVAEFVAS